jgi:hypothetical protein
MHIRRAFPRLTVIREKIRLRFIPTHSLIVLNIPQVADGMFVSTKEHP